MFDIGATELLLIAVVAILVIGPKDMPLALRTAGKWMGKLRRISGHFRSGLDTMIREAEMEEMEKKWRDQNDRIMREHPEGLPAGSGGEPVDPPALTSAEAAMPASDTDLPKKVVKARKPAAGKAKVPKPQSPPDSVPPAG